MQNYSNIQCIYILNKKTRRSNLDLNNTYLEVFMLLKKEKLKENILWKEFVRESLLFDYELECLFKRYGSHRYDLNTLCLANNLVILKRQDESVKMINTLDINISIK